MIERRNFLGIAAAAAALPAIAGPASAAGCAPGRMKSRAVAKVDVLYKTPHPHPNGLAITANPGELWVVDQGPEGFVTLIRAEDGSVIREITPDINLASGVLVDEDNVMWITSTYNRMIVACDPADGRTIAKYITPGAGLLYGIKGDPPLRRSPLPPAYPAAARGPGGPRRMSDLGPGQLAHDAKEAPAGTGAHGIISKGGLLIYACPPSRMMVVIEKKSWSVQATFPTPGNRPHGTAWADAGKQTFWNGDSNLNAFHRFNADTGAITEKIQLPDDSPVIHGAKILGDYMYYCDDVGWMCRFRM